MAGYGWAGKILRVDLTNGRITDVPTADYRPEEFIGGVGLNTKIFWDLGCPRVGAFDPGNPLIISVGPLTGLSGPFGRAEVCGIAPQCYPEELFSYSGFGGKWPLELKWAGYDGLVITGRADEPVYLSIYDERVEIRDASDLWGVDTFETQRALFDVHPEATAICTGPAGENLSRIAIILNETGSAAGQGGFGGVMGSKNLKAIIVRGTGMVKIAKPNEFLKLIEGRKAAGEWEVVRMQEWGRSPLCEDPARTEMVEKYRKKFAGCFGCPFQCNGFFDMPGVGQGYAMCADWFYGFFDPEDTKSTWEGNILTQKLGINNFDMFGLLSFLDSSIKSGALTHEDFNKIGLPVPKWLGGTATGHEFLKSLLYGIAERKNIFSDGTARAAEHFGKEVIDIYKTVYTARGYRAHHLETVGGVLHWATDTRDPFNSCHDHWWGAFGIKAGAPIGERFGIKDGEPIGEHFGVPAGELTTLADPSKTVYEGIERATIWVQHNQCIKDSLIMCENVCQPGMFFHPPEMDIKIFESKAFSAVTGVDMNLKEIEKAGERIWNLRRAVMVKREKRTREEDDVYDPWFNTRWYEPEMGPAGPVDRGKFEALKDRYYKMRGWDVKTGRPTREKLEELGIKEVADELEKLGLLP